MPAYTRIPECKPLERLPAVRAGGQGSADRKPDRAGFEWRPISEAPIDGRPVWGWFALPRDERCIRLIYYGRVSSKRWGWVCVRDPSLELESLGWVPAFFLPHEAIPEPPA